MALSNDELARKVADDIQVGSFVNLGIGLPSRVADFVDPASDVVLHTENGMLGMGPRAEAGDIDPDLVNAGKQPVTERPGASYFDHAASFAMIRGGHLDLCVLGAFEVSVDGDLANWHNGDPEAVPAVGGAMDLAGGAAATWVMMSLFSRDGAAKLVLDCGAPITARHCVARVYTHEGVFELKGGNVVVRDVFGTTVTDLARRLALPLREPSR